jgi:hypothetical protein
VAAFVADVRARNLSRVTIGSYVEALDAGRRSFAAPLARLSLADVSLDAVRAWVPPREIGGPRETVARSSRARR